MNMTKTILMGTGAIGAIALTLIFTEVGAFAESQNPVPNTTAPATSQMQTQRSNNGVVFDDRGITLPGEKKANNANPGTNAGSNTQTDTANNTTDDEEEGGLKSRLRDRLSEFFDGKGEGEGIDMTFGENGDRRLQIDREKGIRLNIPGVINLDLKRDEQ